MPTPRRVATTAFLVSALVLAGFYIVGLRVHHDGEAYFELAVARLYAEQGLVRQLPWGRFSVLGQGFGDKELLFHVALIPFVEWIEPELGSRLALALLGAGIAALVAWHAASALGWWALLLPPWLFLAGGAFLDRVLRLRPELGSLVLLLLALGLAARHRARWLGAVLAVYSLSHTSVHAMLGLCLLWFAAAAWRERRAAWAQLLWPVLGALLGLVVHPHFPDNLRVWVLQNISLFELRGLLDVGEEFGRQAWTSLLALNAGWLLGLGVLWCAFKPDGTGTVAPAERRLAWFTAIAAACFLLLHLLARRFGLYSVPLVTLAVVASRICSGARILARWQVGGRRVPVVALLVLCTLPGVVNLRLLSLDQAARGRAMRQQLDEMRHFGRLLPDGAHVACSWRAAELLAWAAPQARTLNVLDPVFMAVASPEAFAAQARVFAGLEADVATVARCALDSNYVVTSRGAGPSRLWMQLTGDPRVHTLHAGEVGLFEIVPDAVPCPPGGARVTP